MQVRLKVIVKIVKRDALVVLEDATEQKGVTTCIDVCTAIGIVMVKLPVVKNRI